MIIKSTDRQEVTIPFVFKAFARGSRSLEPYDVLVYTAYLEDLLESLRAVLKYISGARTGVLPLAISSVALPTAGPSPVLKVLCLKIPAGAGQLAFQHSTTSGRLCIQHRRSG